MEVTFEFDALGGKGLRLLGRGLRGRRAYRGGTPGAPCRRMGRRLLSGAVMTFILALVSSVPRAEESQCIVGGDGRAACGFACVVGGDGAAACSTVPFGACTVGGNGRAVCFVPRMRLHWNSPRAMCVNGGDGGAACGYACVVGGDGAAACSDLPYGKCAVGGDGRAVCL
jgi:hypothetical protein